MYDGLLLRLYDTDYREGCCSGAEDPTSLISFMTTHPCNKAATEAASASSSLFGECKSCLDCTETDDCCGEDRCQPSRPNGTTSSGTSSLKGRARGVAPADPRPSRIRELLSTLEYVCTGWSAGTATPCSPTADKVSDDAARLSIPRPGVGPLGIARK